MLKKPALTSQIISFLAEIDDLMNIPKSLNQLIYWDKHQYYKNRAKLKTTERKQRKRVKDAMRRLEKASVVTFDKKGKYVLTPKGWLKYLHYYSRKIDKPKEKDEGRYLMFFDIPEEYSRFRNLFRTCLKNLGCQMIQKSVWMTNDLQVVKFMQKISANCELEEYVKFTEIKKIM